MIGWVTTIVIFTAALAACTTTTEHGAVGVERRQLLLVSSAEMDQSATAAYQNVLKTNRPDQNSAARRAGGPASPGGR